RFSFHRRGHERRRRLGDGAALTLEAHVGDGVVLHLHPERELVAAQRIAPFDGAVGTLHLPEVSRLPVVLENDFLIERLGAHTNRASVMRSSSSRISSTSIVSSTSAANAYVSSRRARPRSIPRLLR